MHHRMKSPSFRPDRESGAPFRVKPRQSFKQTDDDAKFRLAGEDGRIERLRFGVVDDGEVGWRFAAGAAGRQNDSAKQKNRAGSKTKTRPRKNPPGAL